MLDTSPPKRAMSRMYFDAMAELADADGRNRVCTPETFRLIWAWEISLSKSMVERRPLMMKSAPMSAATSTTSLAKLSTSMLSRWPSDSSIISSRSARVNSGSPFCGLRIVATTTSSKRWDAVSISSTCPLWIGSNDPG